MNDSKKAKVIKPSTEKKLFALSKNQCYNPNCTNKLITDDKKDVLAKIAHIEAASPNGPRYNPNMTDDERRDFDNLILLCDEHHIEIDSHPNEFPTELLKEWKMLHEGTDGNLLFKHTLKEKYLNHFNTISLLTTNTPKHIDEIFINLSIIKNKKKNEDNGKIPEKQIYDSSWEAIHAPKEPIEIKELINTANKSLIYGKAGIGKTTLCKYIAYKWAKEELYSEFEYVVYIPLREWKNEGIKGAIKDYYYSRDSHELTLDINSQKILFLFDGYDELNGDKKKALISEIEHYTLTHYIITSRPYGYQKSDFRVDEQFETIGFTDENVEEYIETFFKENSEKSKGLKEFLQTNISIKHIAYIPLMLEMICSLWEEGEFGDSLTMTELYSYVIKNMLQKHSANRDDEQVYKRKNRKQIKVELGKIAFEGLTKQKILFDGNLIEDAIEDINFFEQNVIYSGFLKSDVKEKDLLDNYFEFIHLTFQEYFSALYVASLSKEEQSEIIRDWKFYPHMQMFFAFLGGLIEDKEFLLGEIELEPKDLVGVSNFFTIVSIISHKNQKEFSKSRIQNTNRMIYNMMVWLSHCEEEEGFLVYEKLDLINHFIDKNFIQILISKTKDEKIKTGVLEVLNYFQDNEVNSNLSSYTPVIRNHKKKNIDTKNFTIQILASLDNDDNIFIKIFLKFFTHDFLTYSCSDEGISVLSSLATKEERLITKLIHIIKNKDIHSSYKRSIVKVLTSINRRDERFINTLISLTKDNEIEILIKMKISEALTLFDISDDKGVDILIVFIEDKNINFNNKIEAFKILSSLNRADNKIADILIEFIQNGNLNSTKLRAIIAKKLAVSGRKDDKFMDIIVDFLQDENLDSYYRTMAVKALFALDRNDAKLIDRIIHIIKNKDISFEVRIEVSMGYSSLEQSNKGVDMLLSIIQDKNNKEFCKDKAIRFLAILTFDKTNILTKNMINLSPETFIKESSIQSFMYAFDNNYIALEMLIQNAFYNTLPLYIKNNKLHTIENGKEISTQREVDEATLNEIKMLLKGDNLND